MRRSSLRKSLAVPAWTAATALAAVPTWELWRERWELEYGEGFFEIQGCVGMLGGDEWPLSTLRDDLSRVVDTAEGWAVPALAVLLGLLAYVRDRDREVVGRRVAGLLVVIAVVEPLIPMYSEPGGCLGTIPLLSVDWFRAVLGGWGPNQLCLLLAAALVYAASRTAAWEEPVAAATGTAWRRPVAALIDYLVVVTALRVVVEPAWSLISSDGIWFTWFGQGLLGRLDDVLDARARPEELLALFTLLLYFWAQHTLWGRTLGKRLLRVRLVDARTGERLGAGRAALRTLAFPCLAVVPDIGPVLLLAGGLAAFLDARGQFLHDRLLGAAVVRTRHTTGDPHAPDLP
ncbi:RDD family protein [Microbispora sp. KK1-11]|uniref:RDD family protein n=1 Tax=Microbispora sp. KK1-11 TaxID=2053005 RepID=UPI00115A58C8|nr:RDD family protein [Microbispora sp. KK1-11]TQS21837.1 RDD family protein [Microbispora sp. KK1-11]